MAIATHLIIDLFTAGIEPLTSFSLNIRRHLSYFECQPKGSWEGIAVTHHKGAWGLVLQHGNSWKTVKVSEVENQPKHKTEV